MEVGREGLARPNLSARQEATLEAIPRRVGGILASALPASKKYIRLVELADETGKAIAPHTPCHKGCSHCCKIAVAISAREAALIGEHTGRTPAPLDPVYNPDTIIARLDENVKRFELVPCPFLDAAGACSIYDVRPMSCRTFHTLNPSAELCDLSRGRNPITQFDLSGFAHAVVAIDLMGAFGDIREFFPGGVSA